MQFQQHQNAFRLLTIPASKNPAAASRALLARRGQLGYSAIGRNARKSDAFTPFRTFAPSTQERGPVILANLPNVESGELFSHSLRRKVW